MQAAWPRWRRTRRCSARCSGWRYEHPVFLACGARFACFWPSRAWQPGSLRRACNEDSTMTLRDRDWAPLALVPALAMGMIIFIIASGLTLVFGLMDVLNFGHGLFITLGAFIASTVLGAMGDWTGSEQLWRNLVAVLSAMLVAMAVAAAVGLAFERCIVRPVYGQHLKQILITMGGMIIGEELIKLIWGPAQIPLPLPEGLRGALLMGDAAIEKYRLVAVAVGLLVFGALAWMLARTKLGLLIRAGVQGREMVEALGYRIRRLFVAMFLLGSPPPPLA